MYYSKEMEIKKMCKSQKYEIKMKYPEKTQLVKQHLWEETELILTNIKYNL